MASFETSNEKAFSYKVIHCEYAFITDLNVLVTAAAAAAMAFSIC